MAQGIRFEELIEATRRLKGEEAKAASTPTERMSVEEFKRIAEEEISKPLKGIEENIKQQTSNSKKMFDEIKKQTEQFERFTKAQYENAEAIASMASNLETYSSPTEKLKEKFTSIVSKLSPSNIKETALKAVNVKIPGIGGIFDKQILQEQYAKKQTALGSTKSKADLKKDFEEYNTAAKEVKNNEQEIEKTKKQYGMSDSVFKKSKIGKQLLAKQVESTSRLEKVDLSAQMVKTAEDDTKTAQREQTEKLEKQEARATAVKEEKDLNFSDESQLENQRNDEQQTELLKKIEENTRPTQEAVEEKPKEKEGRGIFGNIFDGLMQGLGMSLKGAFKVLFNPRNILKVIGKIFVPAMIIGSLVNGIVDAFKVFFNGGTFVDALIAGLGGILDFLTFGLVDAKTLHSIIDFFSGLIDDYIIEPIKNFMSPVVDFFAGIKDSVLGFFNSFEIPGISFTIPVIDKEVSFGPWKPFSSKQSSSNPTTAAGNKAPTATANAKKIPPTAQKKRTETFEIANEPVVPGQPLSENQVVVVDMAMSQGNKYPPEVMKSYQLAKEKKSAAAAPVAAAPTEAATVYNKSAQVAPSAQAPAQAPVVVNAPTQISNTSKQNIAIPAPIRNNDSGLGDYVKKNSVFI